jgi:hypothetical protein
MVYARHATDGEKIVLQGGRLVVELENGGDYERTEFLPHQVRIEPQTGDRSLIEVSGQGRSVRVGAMYARSCVPSWPARFAWRCVAPEGLAQCLHGWVCRKKLRNVNTMKSIWRNKYRPANLLLAAGAAFSSAAHAVNDLPGAPRCASSIFRSA